MRRIAGTFTCVLLCLAVVALSVGGSSAFAVRPAAPTDLSGGYILHRDLGGAGYTRSLMTLLQNHTGYTDLDTITWSRTGQQITLVFTSRTDPSDQSTYTGALTPHRISSRRHPGSFTTSGGEPGVFYAINH